MKKNTSLLIALWLFSTLMAFGQNKITYALGVTGGLNASLIKNGFGYKNILWRYNAGLALEQRFSSRLALVYQLQYSRQGETVKEQGYAPATGTTFDTQIITFDYITLPIMVRFRPKKERFFFEAGGQVGALTYNYFYITSSPNQGSPFYHTNKLDAGLTGGVGYRLGRHLVVDARYYYGMKPILADYSAIDPQSGVSTFYKVDKWYNRVYSLNLSYFFR